MSDIPKEKINESEKNKKKYIDVIVNERKETDNYGNTHTVFISQSKVERDNAKDKIYIGAGKLIATK